MADDRKSYVFGPAPSRRLGRSLGVDLTPYKTCSLNCLYCQLGESGRPTIKRRVHAPAEAVLADVKRKLSQGVQADCVTMSGSGEPTLNMDIGRVIAGVKEMTDLPVVVLTNGTLLWDPAVRRDLLPADIVAPSLDAGDEAVFQRINRPAEGLTFDRLVEGLIAFRRQYTGRLLLEVFFAAGINDDDEQARKIAAVAEKIGPERVQLNTAARPPADPAAKPVTEKRLRELAAFFGDKAEVIADFDKIHQRQAAPVDEGDMLALLDRRPLSVKDAAACLDISPSEASKRLGKLVDDGLVTVRRSGAGGPYYVRARPSEPGSDDKEE